MPLSDSPASLNLRSQPDDNPGNCHQRTGRQPNRHESHAGQSHRDADAGRPPIWNPAPAVPFAKVTIINRSRTQVYISLQNYPTDRPAAFLEYPVKNQVKVNAPLGYYVYVVWVGGRKIVGEFHRSTRTMTSRSRYSETKSKSIRKKFKSR
ncbi:MAG: hypothetical protein MZV70_21620 [Desulfobacterales bacterium]|nr:hypothetical protein [Desulfobacterales bacterium]